MDKLSRLELVALHRPGWRAGSAGAAERWSWDFVVDGISLHERLDGDVVGILGWGDPAWEAAVVDGLLGRAAPDVAPDRVALYVCPECADLGCGAVTAAVARAGGVVAWRDFAWERGGDAPGEGRRYGVGPFRFDRGAYGRLLRAAAGTRPGPASPRLSAA